LTIQRNWQHSNTCLQDTRRKQTKTQHTISWIPLCANTHKKDRH